MKPENWVFEHYHEFAEKINPVLRAALAGQLRPKEQKQMVEAWLGLALFHDKVPVSLEEIIASADAINFGIPTPEEVAWGFLRLKERGWLAIDGDLYGLTSEGRRAIDTIVSQGNVERLTDWISIHPPSGRMTAIDVFLTLGKRKTGKD